MGFGIMTHSNKATLPDYTMQWLTTGYAVFVYSVTKRTAHCTDLEHVFAGRLAGILLLTYFSLFCSALSCSCTEIQLGHNGSKLMTQRMTHSSPFLYPSDSNCHWCSIRLAQHRLAHRDPSCFLCPIMIVTVLTARWPSLDFAYAEIQTWWHEKSCHQEVLSNLISRPFALNHLHWINYMFNYMTVEFNRVNQQWIARTVMFVHYEINVYIDNTTFVLMWEVGSLLTSKCWSHGKIVVVYS